MESFNLQQHRLIAHNAMFDGFILYHSFSIVPSNWCDTLSMGRAIHTIEVGGSLKELARYYNLGIKGDEVIYAVGKKRLDFTQTELDAYGEYCKTDCELTEKLFEKFIRRGYAAEELKLIDLTLRMFTEPTLILDTDVLRKHIKEIKNKKETF